MNTYVFENENFVGFFSVDFDNVFKCNLNLDCVVPEGLMIAKANITIFHSPIFWNVFDSTSLQAGHIWGYCRNIRLYKATNLYSRLLACDWGGEIYVDENTTNYSEVLGAFGDNGFTANIPSNYSHDGQSITSIDLKDSLVVGVNRFKIATANGVIADRSIAAENTGNIRAMIDIEGYMTYV